MPASSIDSYLHDARNNFDAVRPAPVYADANQTMGQCQNIHVSTNHYYGYHYPKNSENIDTTTDYEMLELPRANGKGSSQQSTARKRCADNSDYPQSKRLRQDDSSICSLVGTRSSPSHSASAFNVNIPTLYSLRIICRVIFRTSV